MSAVADRLAARGWTLAAPMRAPGGARFPFVPVRVSGSLAWVSGHLPLAADGTVAGPLGRVGGAVSADEGREAAHRVALAMLGSLERELGSLERIERWLRAFVMVNHVEGFAGQPAVANGFSETVLELFGEEIGAHSRSAIGVAGLPFDAPVEIEAVVEIRP